MRSACDRPSSSLGALLVFAAVAGCAASRPVAQPAQAPQRPLPARDESPQRQEQLRSVRLATIDWSKERRAALVAAMQQGIAVFGYRNGSATLIAPCWIAGRYTLVALEPDREIVGVRDPAGGDGRGARAGAPRLPALPLIELTMTSSWRTLIPQESRLYLEGACAEATHVARAVNVGYTTPVWLAPPPAPGTLYSPDTSPAEGEPPEILDIVLSPVTVDFTVERGEPTAILPRETEQAEVAVIDGTCGPSDFWGCMTSCASGSARSCHNLALLLGYRSAGAIALLEAACDRRVGEACYALARAYETTRQARPEVRALYEIACGAGFAMACWYVAAWSAPSPHSPEWAERAFPLYVRACQAGDVSACARVAFEHEFRGRTAEAVELYPSTCRAGSLRSCERWARLLEEGRSATRYPMFAEDLHRFACSRLHISSCLVLQERGVETGHPDIRPHKP